MGISFLKVNPDRVMLDGLDGVPKHFAQMNVDAAVQAQKAKKIGDRYEALLKECEEVQLMLLREMSRFVSMTSSVNAFAPFLSETQRDIIMQRLVDSCDPETPTESTDGATAPDDKGENDPRRAIAKEISDFIQDMNERSAARGTGCVVRLHDLTGKPLTRDEVDEISARVMKEAAERLGR